MPIIWKVADVSAVDNFSQYKMMNTLNSLEKVKALQTFSVADDSTWRVFWWGLSENIYPTKVFLWLLCQIFCMEINLLQNCCGCRYNKLARLANFVAMFRDHRNFPSRSGWLENSNETSVLLENIQIVCSWNSYTVSPSHCHIGFI